MRYINSIYEFLIESVQSYNWEFISDDGKKIKYKFNDLVNNLYLVEFKKITSRNSVNEYELTYYVYDNDKNYYNVSKLTNVNPYRILKTIFSEILTDFINRNPLTKNIKMEGLSKDYERNYISQRTKMYVRYLERNPINGYKLETFGNRINLIKI